MLCSFKFDTQFFIISQNKLFCVSPSATELNYPFNLSNDDTLTWHVKKDT